MRHGVEICLTDAHYPAEANAKRLVCADGVRIASLIFLRGAGVTRGRRLVVCVGTRKALAMAIKKADLAQRFSGLRQRLAPSDGSKHS